MMDHKAIRIVKWHERHENAQSRKVEGSLPWIRVPTSQSSMGLRRLLSLKNGAELFGIYILLAEIAGTCCTRGVLADEHGPLSLGDIAIRTGIKENVIKSAVESMLDKNIGWLDYVDGTQSDPKRTPTGPQAEPKATPSESIRLVEQLGVHAGARASDSYSPSDSSSSVEGGPGETLPPSPGRKIFDPVEWPQDAVHRIFRAYPHRQQGLPRSTMTAIREALTRIQARHPDMRATLDWLESRTAAFAKSDAAQRGRFTVGAQKWFDGDGFDQTEAQWERPPDPDDAPSGMSKSDRLKVIERVTGRK